MASSKGSNTYNRQNWEDSSFPILCETCLGPSPYVRMMKEKYGKECKICQRPFTIFRWCPGPKARFKKTEICQTCAKVKNVCQTCIFDLEYGLPVEVRDKALRVAQHLPRSEVNREYFHQQVEQQLELAGDVTAPYGGHELVGKMLSGTVASTSFTGSGGADMLLKLARTTPYYRRNRPHICSFWVKGECRRGEECPYRHEKPTDPDDPLSDQNLKDRYYGQNDPVASKLLSKYHSMPKLTPPDDRTITTLYIGNIPDIVSEKELRDHFYQFGEIRSIHMHAKQHCAFVQFTLRDAAERAAEKTYDRLILGGHRLSVNWGKSPTALAAAALQAAAAQDGADPHSGLPPVPGLPLPPKAPPPGVVLSQATSIPAQMIGTFFSSPPPPLLSVSSTLGLTRSGSLVPGIQLAPPVIEPPPPGADVFLRGPPPPPLPPPPPGYLAGGLPNLVSQPPPAPPVLLSTPLAAHLTGVPLPAPPVVAITVAAVPISNIVTETQESTPNDISPPGLLAAPVQLNEEQSNSSESSSPVKTTVGDKTLLKLADMGIHYPSQNPQRMGSVPHAQKI
ncbi:unnamed protein product [Protopolystoma xenopodis]|uniref:Pre-mRNA-splicing factor RBM22 n=1 Tax=Protopolystoma xenopodis TaxID=117903 RepID=A0A3S5BS63_9PLAT|nr:unnamed protein product [Protopolystoma xenopodis]